MFKTKRNNFMWATLIVILVAFVNKMPHNVGLVNVYLCSSLQHHAVA